MRDEIDQLQMREFIIHAKRAVAADSVVLFTARHTESERDHDILQTAITANVDVADNNSACFLALVIAEWCDQILNDLTCGECRVKVTGAPYNMEEVG